MQKYSLAARYGYSVPQDLMMYPADVKVARLVASSMTFGWTPEIPERRAYLSTSS